MFNSCFFLKKGALVAALSGIMFTGVMDSAHAASSKAKATAPSTTPCTGTRIDMFFTGQFTAASSFISDASGNFYVAGAGYYDNRVCHWVIRKSSDQGKTWNIVDNYQYQPGAATSSDIYPELGTDIHGNIYCCGFGFDAQGQRHWVVRKSVDQGVTWNTVDDFKPSNAYATATAFASDASGNLYVAGWTNDKGGQHWIVRKSSDQGGTWTQVDSFQSEPKAAAQAAGCTVDAQGNIYVVGYCSSTKGTHWIVRKSTNAGISWTTVDDFQNKGQFSIADAVAVDANGAIYVSGQGYTNTSNASWIVRKSADGGATWTTVDTFQNASGDIARARAIGVDDKGNVYAAGSSKIWYVRRSTDQGATWTTVDNPGGFYEVARGIGFDANGNVYPVGAGGARWIVRKLACTN